MRSPPRSIRSSALPSLKMIVEMRDREMLASAQYASETMMSDAVAVSAMGRDIVAGSVPRQVGYTPLHSGSEMRVQSRTMQGLDLIKRIEERLKELRLSSQAASLKVGNNRDLIRNVTRFGEKANPKQETLIDIAKALDWTVEELLRESPAPLSDRAGTEFVIADVPVPATRELPKNVPVMGTAMGSLFDEKFEGIEVFSDPIEYVRRPPSLMTVPDAYAIYVVGDSMYPMHSPGDLRFVHPHKQPRPGSTVIVQTRHWEHDPGQAYIKIFRRRTATSIVLEQFNPSVTIEIPIKYVVSVHYVPDLTELFAA